MYTFYKTSDAIANREGVIKQLKKLESTDAKVEIWSFVRGGSMIFGCKISNDKLVRGADGRTPELACGAACDIFIRDLRESKEKMIDKKRRNNTKNNTTDIVNDDINNI